MERKIATQLTRKVKALVALKFNSKYYSTCDSRCIFNYPNFNDSIGFKEGFHVESFMLDYELVSEQEFLDYFETKIESIKDRCEASDSELKLDINFDKPIHYSQTKSGMDVFDVANDWNIKEPELFSALKYILRCGKKDEAVKEIEKAIDCLQRYKERI